MCRHRKRLLLQAQLVLVNLALAVPDIRLCSNLILSFLGYIAGEQRGASSRAATIVKNCANHWHLLPRASELKPCWRLQIVLSKTEGYVGQVG